LPGDALLDEAAAKISVDHATFGPLDSIAQALVRYPLAPCKPRKPFHFENLHVAALTL
jgi:hypothetical protein